MAMALSVLPSTPFHEKESSIQFRTFEPILVQFQQEIVKIGSQKKEEHVEEDDKGWTIVTHKKKRQSKSTQKELRFHRNYKRGSKNQKNKSKKKVWMPRLVKEEDENFPQL